MGVNQTNYRAILDRQFPSYRWICDPLSPNLFECGDEIRKLKIEFPKDDALKGFTKVVFFNMKLSGNPVIADYVDEREDLAAVLETLQRQINAWKWTPGTSTDSGMSYLSASSVPVKAKTKLGK